MWLTHRGERIERNFDVTIRSILEPDRSGEAARHLAVGLRLGRSCTDCGPGNEIVQVLRCDRIESFCCTADTELCNVDEETSRLHQPFIDLEGIVEIGIV